MYYGLFQSSDTRHAPKTSKSSSTCNYPNLLNKNYLFLTRRKQIISGVVLGKGHEEH